MDKSNYDYIIVGAGIAGLHCALRVVKSHPRAKIAVMEMYGTPGGRMATYHNPSKDLQWEEGAGRVHSSHTLTLKYAKQYGITLEPIPFYTAWKDMYDPHVSKDLWPSLSAIISNTLSNFVLHF